MAASGWPDTPGMIIRVLDFSEDGQTLRGCLSGFWIFLPQTSENSQTTLKMAFDEKTFNTEVVRLVETVKIAFGLISIQGRLSPQKGPSKYSQFKPNSFGKFG